MKDEDMHIHGSRDFSLILAMYKGGEVVERDS
jgi:hypothetical protein